MRPERPREQLVHSVLDGKVGQAAVDMVAEAATMRWAGGRTFAAALERQAVRAQLMAADRAGDSGGDRGRALPASPGRSRRTRAARTRWPIGRSGWTGREELVGGLLAGRATDDHGGVGQASRSRRERTFAHTIEGFVTLAAAQKNRVVATVRVAQPLTAEQRERAAEPR